MKISWHVIMSLLHDVIEEEVVFNQRVDLELEWQKQNNWKPESTFCHQMYLQTSYEP